MKEQENKANWNSTTGKPEPKQDATHKVDPQHADVKHDEALGRVGIAPSKPVWPPKK